MPRKPLSDKSETVRLELRIPAALKAEVEKKLKDKQTLSSLIREYLEKVAK